MTEEALAQMTSSVDDFVDRCLRRSKFPNTLYTEDWLGQERDYHVDTLLEWVLHHQRFLDWRDEEDVGVLYLHAGPGKGKTTTTLGIIDNLYSTVQQPSILAHFFFCGADCRLNSRQAMVKCLISQLVSQRKELAGRLRAIWDPNRIHPQDDSSAWPKLWDLFTEILAACSSDRVYLIIDGLDECEEDEGVGLLQVLLRAKIDHSFRVKWLVTRQTGSYDLAQHSEEFVTLNLDSAQLPQAVESYISSKLAELEHRHRYGQELRLQLKSELTQNAESTFLWARLACSNLNYVASENSLAITECMPRGLEPFYDWSLQNLCDGDPEADRGCIRLLKIMSLIYQPLTLAEADVLLNSSGSHVNAKSRAQRCSSFIEIRADFIEFVHNSARIYLSGSKASAILNAYDSYGHMDLALACLSFLRIHIRAKLARPKESESRSGVSEAVERKISQDPSDTVRYAAMFWTTHLHKSGATRVTEDLVAENGVVSNFVYTTCLEWLEILISLGEVARAFVEMEKLSKLAISVGNNNLARFLQHSLQLLAQYHHTLEVSPSQIYSSAIVFSPKSSLVRQKYLDKLPPWLKGVPEADGAWTALIQTIHAHSKWVNAISLTSDGAHTVSISRDMTTKLWDTNTGVLQRRMTGHTAGISDVTCSKDGRYIVTCSADHSIKVWDVSTGNLHKTLSGHLDDVTTVAISMDGDLVASGSFDKTIRLWKIACDGFRRTLTDHSTNIHCIAFSPNGEQLVSGSVDKTLLVWDVSTGRILRTLVDCSATPLDVGYSPDGAQIAAALKGAIKIWSASTGVVQRTLSSNTSLFTSLAFSPDGRKIAAGCGDSKVQNLMYGTRDLTAKIWDVSTGELESVLPGHSDWVTSVAFSKDGQRLISSSRDGTIKLWEAASNHLRAPAGHSNWVNTIAYSPDGQRIASGSRDWTIKIWGALGRYEETLIGHSDWINCIIFLPDNKRVVSASADKTIKIWDVATANCDRTLLGHQSWVIALAVSSSGHLLASSSDDGTIKLWDPMTGSHQKTLNHRSSSINVLTFSTDETKIVSGAQDGTIALWNISNRMSISNVIQTVIRKYVDVNEYDNLIKLDGAVEFLRFTPDGQEVCTNLGRFAVEDLSSLKGTPTMKPHHGLHVRGPWICRSSEMLLYLPSHIEPYCYDVKDQQICLGLKNGGVLGFRIADHSEKIDLYD